MITEYKGVPIYKLRQHHIDRWCGGACPWEEVSWSEMEELYQSYVKTELKKAQQILDGEREDEL